MEFVKGGSLSSLIEKKKKFSDDEASTIVKNILKAIEHVHEKNYIHRDLKPQNILLDDENDLESVKIADFGLSAIFKVNPTFFLNEKMGTLLFMTPE